MNLRLRIPEEEIAPTAESYLCPPEEDSLLARRGRIQVQGYLAMKDLRDAARWKSPRIMRVIDRNCEQYVEEITRFAFSTSCERARIQSLTVLDGVGWPTASVLLHLFHQDPYPILDFRALWSVSLDVPTQYSFAFWWEYVMFCRTTADATGVDMRTLYRALWQHSKENQHRQAGELAGNV